jgi:hypothetical protein
LPFLFQETKEGFSNRKPSFADRVKLRQRDAKMSFYDFQGYPVEGPFYFGGGED